MRNENRDVAPVLLKFGVALALSFGGVLYSFIINRRSKASQSPNDHRNCSDCDEQGDSRSNRLPFDPLATDKHEESHRSNNIEVVRIDSESPKGYSCAEKDAHEREIKSLRNTVKILQERECSLEIKLLEYYGLKEQETVVMELQNRLKLKNMEAKFYALKMESLHADNRRLEAHMTDYKKVVSDLEAAQIIIKMLKKKLKLEAEQHKKKILHFHQQVQNMQEDKSKHAAGIEPEMESKLHKLKALEAEVAELRTSNHALQMEKAELAHRLGCVQILATSVLEDAEKEKVKEENQNLRKQNEDLSKQMERIQADRWADIEQLVYLRWINACLRYELRNYQPAAGKTTARDLSRTLSPESEQKAKQLILEYANQEDGCQNSLSNLQEINSDQWCDSQASVVVDSVEFDEFKVLKHRHSDFSFYNRIGSVREDSGGGGGRRWSCASSIGGERSVLVKYAEALKDSGSTSKFKSHPRSPSLKFL